MIARGACKSEDNKSSSASASAITTRHTFSFGFEQNNKLIYSVERKKPVKPNQSNSIAKYWHCIQLISKYGKKAKERTSVLNGLQKKKQALLLFLEYSSFFSFYNFTRHAVCAFISDFSLKCKTIYSLYLTVQRYCED